MVHIYTFCDKTLLGRKNLSAKILCEELYKLNFKISDIMVCCSNYDYSSINFKNNDIYFLLMEKSSNILNGFLANLCGEDLVTNETLKKSVVDYFSLKNIPMDKAVELEWLIPKSAKAITNPIGRVQGYIVTIGGSQIFVLPNEEKELAKIISDCLIEYLENKYSFNYKSETFKTFGLSEEHIFNVLKEQIKNKDKINVTINSKGLDLDIVLKAKSDNTKFEEYRRIIFSKLEKYIYSVQDFSLIDYFIKEIDNQKLKISIGGDMSVGHIITQIPTKLHNSILGVQIMPSNKLITQYLGSNVDFQDKPKIVYDIAVKMLEKSQSDIALVCLCDTKDENNRGVSYIAIGNRIKIDIYKNRFSGNDDEIYSSVASTALFYLVKRLQQKDLKII